MADLATHGLPPEAPAVSAPQQIAYRFTNLDTVCAILRERGIRLLYDIPKPVKSGSRINFIHPGDAGGILVKLVEPEFSVIIGQEWRKQ